MKFNLGDIHREHKTSCNCELEKQYIKKKILVLNSHTSSFNLLLTVISKYVNLAISRKTCYIGISFCKSSKNFMHWNLSENMKFLQK